MFSQRRLFLEILGDRRISKLRFDITILSCKSTPTQSLIKPATMFTARKDAEMKRNIKKILYGPNSHRINPIEKLRLYCLTRGSGGIMGLGRWVRQNVAIASYCLCIQSEFGFSWLGFEIIKHCLPIELNFQQVCFCFAF